MPISGKGAPASHFSPENDRKGRFGGRKWLATGLEGKPRSEVGGPRSENRHPCPSVPTSACRDPWSDWIPTSEVRDRRPERSICVDLREFAVVFSVLVALEDLNWTLARNFVPLCLGVRRLGVLKSRNHLSQRHGVTEGEWGFGRNFASLRLCARWLSDRPGEVELQAFAGGEKVVLAVENEGGGFAGGA